MLILASLFIVTNLRRDTPTLRPHPGWVYAASLALLLTLCLLMIAQPQAFLYFQF